MEQVVISIESSLPKVEEPVGRAVVPGLSEQNFEKIIEEANANAAAQRKLLLDAAKKMTEKKSSSSSAAKSSSSSGIFKKRESSDSLSRSKSDSKRKHDGSSKSKSGSSNHSLPKDVLKFRRGVKKGAIFGSSMWSQKSHHNFPVQVSEIVIKTLSKHKSEINTDLFKQLARKVRDRCCGRFNEIFKYFPTLLS